MKIYFLELINGGLKKNSSSLKCTRRHEWVNLIGQSYNITVTNMIFNFKRLICLLTNTTFFCLLINNNCLNQSRSR